MEPLTQNDLKQLDTAALLLQAQAIRDAVAAKTVSARQVGELFCGLIEACDDINPAISLFLLVLKIFRVLLSFLFSFICSNSSVSKYCL